MAERIAILFVGCLFLAPGVAHAVPDGIDACFSCHGEDGAGVGYDDVPIIAGTPAAHLEEALFAYKDGARRCVRVPFMCEEIESLSDDQIIELAAYFAARPRPGTKEDFDARLAATGKAIHNELCARCHVLPTDDGVGDALGIPLNGQKSAYLRLALDAYLNGSRDTLIPMMAERLRMLDPEKIDALINYYASWNPEP